MEDLKQNNFKTVFTKKRVELAIGIVVMILIGLVFLGILINTPGSNNLTDIIEEKPFNYSAITFSDPKEISFNNYKVTLSEGWEIGFAFNGNLSEDIFCADKSQCDIYQVTNGEDSYFISIPSVFKNSLFETTTTKEEKPFTFGIIEFTLSQVETLSVEGETSDEEGTITNSEQSDFVTSEIYGCFESICFNSGRISTEHEENSLEIKAFYDFVTSVSITK